MLTGGLAKEGQKRQRHKDNDGVTGSASLNSYQVQNQGTKKPWPTANS
jgi:hypothetical protein